MEDHVDAANAITRVLQHCGYEVATAFDGLEAVAVAEEFRPQLVLLDILLPRLDGRSVARRLRETSWGAGLFIAAMSQLDSPDDELASLQAGCNVHLAKPILRIGPLVGSLFAQFDVPETTQSSGRSATTTQPTVPQRAVVPTARHDLIEEDLPFLAAVLHDRHPADAASIWNDWRDEAGRGPMAPSGDWRSEAFRLLLAAVAPAFAARRLWLTDDDCKATRATQGRLSKLAIDAVFQTATAVGVPVVRAYPPLPASPEFRGLGLVVETRLAGRWWVVIERVHEWELQDEMDLVRAIVVAPFPPIAVERYAAWLDSEGTAETHLNWRRLIASPLVRSLAFQRLLALALGRRLPSLEAVWLVSQPDQATPHCGDSARDRVLVRLERLAQQAGLIAKIETVALDDHTGPRRASTEQRRLLTIRTSFVEGSQTNLIGYVRLDRKQRPSSAQL